MSRHTKADGYTMVELLVALAIAGVIGAAIVGVYRVSQDTYIRASSLEAAQTGARVGLDRMANELRLIGSYWVGATCIGIADCNAITAASSNSITFRANVYDLYMPNATALEATATNNVTANTVSLSLSASDTDNAFKVYGNNALNDYIYIANAGTRELKQINTIGSNTLTLVSNLSSTYPVGSLVRDVKTITYTRNAGANTLTRTQGGDAADTIVDNVTGLFFIYFDSTGIIPNPPAPCSGPGPNLAANLIREIRVDLQVQGPDGSARCMTTRVKPRSLP